MNGTTIQKASFKLSQTTNQSSTGGHSRVKVSRTKKAKIKTSRIKNSRIIISRTNHFKGVLSRTASIVIELTNEEIARHTGSYVTTAENTTTSRQLV